MKTDTFKYTTEMLLWKENNIDRVEFQFSCGGDSMNDTSIDIYTNDNRELSSEVENQLNDFFDDAVYKNVEFYEVSDGHYMGESGVVIITLEEGDGEAEFVYDKQATSEWEESVTESFEVELSDEETKFIREKVSNMNGGDWGTPNINYKVDCIVNDDEEVLIDNLVKKIDGECQDYEFEEKPGEPQEEYQWTTNEDGDELELNDNKLTINVTQRFFVTKSENY